MLQSKSPRTSRLRKTPASSCSVTSALLQIFSSTWSPAIRHQVGQHNEIALPYCARRRALRVYTLSMVRNDTIGRCSARFCAQHHFLRAWFKVDLRLRPQDPKRTDKVAQRRGCGVLMASSVLVWISNSAALQSCWTACGRNSELGSRTPCGSRREAAAGRASRVSFFLPKKEFPRNS